MNNILIVLVATFLNITTSVYAQSSMQRETNIITSNSNVSGSESTVGTPEWLLTMAVIKLKTNNLLIANERLSGDRKFLQDQFLKFQSMIQEQESKNESIRQFIKAKQGRSEQQARIEQLQAEINTRNSKIKELEKGIEEEQKKYDKYERKVGIKKMKFFDLENRQKKGKLRVAKKVVKKTSLEPKDDELISLNEKLKDEKAQEENLNAQLDNLKQAFAAKDAANDSKSKELQAKLTALLKEKEDLQKQGNADNNQAKIKRLEVLQAKKAELEQKIKGFEEQLEQLKNPQSLGLMPSAGKNDALRQMIQLDTTKIQLNQKIADMRQDNNLLKEQVSRLERKVQFVKDSAEHNK